MAYEVSQCSRSWLAAVLIAAGLVSVARSQTFPQTRLETVKQLACVFPLLANGTWNRGDPRADVRASTLSMRFDSINLAESTARVTEGFGHFDITAHLSRQALHFVQVLKTGPLYATTVFESESRSGKLKAVHSRHELTEALVPGFTSSPEQYYGECEIER